MLLRRFLLPAAILFSLVLSSADASGRTFTARFSQDLSGNIVFAANALMTCSTTGTNGGSCSGSRTNSGLGTSADATLTNNHYDMVNIDVDGVASTPNSSSATLNIPAGSKVVWAGLYWAANEPSGMTQAQAKSIKLRGPDDSSYQSLTASDFDAAPGSAYGYDCFLEVTEIVDEQGSGQWTAGGVTNRLAQGVQAGWALVVVYGNNSEPTRNLTVFDGQEIVAGSDEINIPVSGFRTPPTGAVDTTLGMITFEGDRGIVGDYAQLDGNTLSDAKHLSTNFFNSWFATGGIATTGRTPSYNNALGFEASTFAVGSVLGNNTTSATIRTKTSGDGYQPMVFSFATELYAPHFNPLKSVEDLNGGEVRAGDILEYTIDLENDGGDNATNMVFSESAMPAGTGYVGDSVLVDGVAPDPATVDQPADGGTGALTLRLGTGADSTQGGTVAPGESHQIKFQVEVNSPLPAQGAKISNQALMNFVFESLGRPMQVETNVSDITVRLPDLAMAKTQTSANIADGLPGQYTLKVSNVGLSDTSGTVTVTDTLPEQFKNPTVSSATGWDCAITAGELECTRSDALAPGADYPNIVIDSPAMDIPGGETVENTASVDADLDPDPTNNSSTVSTSEQGTSSLAVSNAAGAASVAPGSSIQFTADYSNTGPSTALNPTLVFRLTDATTSDLQISDYTVTSSNGSVVKADCALTTPSNVPTITCTPDALAKDASVQIVATLTVDPGSALSSFNTRATIQAANDAGSPHQDDASTNLQPSADLALTKTASPSQANRGATVTYTLQVSNSGPSASGAVTLTDPVPAGMAVQTATWTKSSGGSGSCAVASNTVTCSMPSILPTQTLAVSIVTQVSQSASGYQNNTAAVSGAVDDPDPENNDASEQFTVLPSANLEVIKSGPSGLAPEQSGIFTFQLKNHGPSNSPNTVLTENLPQGMSLVGSLPRGCSRAGSKITCRAGTLASGSNRSYKIRLRINPGTKTGNNLTNTAQVSSSVTELVPSNNTDQIQIQVRRAARPRLGIQLWVRPNRGAQPGQPVRLIVRITNKGYATVNRPKACVTVPLNLWGNPYRHICWYDRSLAGGRSKTFSVLVSARRPGVETVRAGTEAQNAWWTGTRKRVIVQGGFTG